MAKILVSMPDKFLNKIDKIANEEQRSRSELVREALRSYLKKNNSTNNKQNEASAKILEELLD